MDVAKSSLKIFVSETSTFVLSFFSLIYYSRALGSATLGTFFLFQGVYFFLSKPADLGIRFATEKRISEGETPSAVLSTAMLMKAGLLVVVLTGLFVARGRVNAYLGAELVGLLAVALVLREVTGLLKNAISGELRVGKTAYMDFTYHSIKYLGGVLLVYLGYGVVGLVVALIVGQFVQLLLAFRERNTRFGRPGASQLYSIADYAKFTIIPSFSSQFYQWLDILVIGFLLTHASVGAYEVAWRTAGPVLLLSRSISVVMFPQISAWDSAGTKDAIERLISRSVTPSLVLVFPALFGTLVLSEEILTLVFGQEYGTAWLVLIVLMAGQIPSGLQNVTKRSLYGLDRAGLETVASSVEITANVLLNVVLILQFGIVGAAIGTSLSVTIGVLGRAYFLSRLVELRIPYRELGWCVFASAVMAALLYAAKTEIEVDTAVRLAGFILTGAILYGSVLLLYSPLRAQITTQLRKNVPWPL